MKRLSLPSGKGGPAWGGLFGALGAAYVFVAPYQNGAGALEWLLTSLAVVVFLFLFIVGLIYWSRRRLLLLICAAITVLAFVFTLYRPAGIVFYLYVAGLAPFATGGHIVRSVAAIGGVVALLTLQSWLLWPPGAMPYVIAIETLLLGAGMTFVARQQTAVERVHRFEERERIAHDMHDVLGQALSTVVLKSELVSRLIDQDVSRARAEVADIERIAREALAEVRQVIAGYVTGSLSGEFERARSVLQSANITADVNYAAESQMPLSHERVLALALREAVTNVVRHSRAKRCRLSLDESREGFRLMIVDDGAGGEHMEGFGMRGIRQRVSAIGGDVRWLSREGTQVTITVPLARESA